MFSVESFLVARSLFSWSIWFTFFKDIVLEVELGTKTTERFESSYTEIAKYAMENVRTVNVFIIITIITTSMLVRMGSLNTGSSSDIQA